MALQGAGQHLLKAQALELEVFAQPLALALSEFAELVVVLRTKRGLAMAHKVEGSHHWNLSQIGL